MVSLHLCLESSSSRKHRLYSLGLYEQSSTHVMGAIFEEDYTTRCTYFAFHCPPPYLSLPLSVMHSGSVLWWTWVYTVGLALASGWTYIWIHAIYGAWKEGMTTRGNPFEDLLSWTSGLTLSVVGLLLSTGIGLICGISCIISIFKLLEPPFTSTVLRLCRRVAPRQSSLVDSATQDRPSLIWGKIVLPLVAMGSYALGELIHCTSSQRTLSSSHNAGWLTSVVLYLVVHCLAFALSVGWVSTCIMFVNVAADIVRTSPWYMRWFGMFFCIQGSLGVALGIFVMLFILASFFSIFFLRRHLLVKSWTL